MLRNKANSINLQRWVLPILILLTALLIEIGGDSLRELLRYQSDSFENNEFWRLLTGHLTHLGWSHLLLNALGFIFVWALFENVYSTKRWVFIFLITCLSTSLLFYFFDKQLTWYVGLSGVLHGLIMAGVLTAIYQYHSQTDHWNKADILLLIAIIFKLAYEQFLGAVPLTAASSGGPVVVNAHFYGAIIGTICTLFFAVIDSRSTVAENV